VAEHVDEFFGERLFGHRFGLPTRKLTFNVIASQRVGAKSPPDDRLREAIHL
jgi:hypothetical protein